MRVYILPNNSGDNRHADQRLTSTRRQHSINIINKMHTSMPKHVMNCKKCTKLRFLFKLILMLNELSGRSSLMRFYEASIEKCNYFNLRCIDEVAEWLTWHMNVGFSQRFHIPPVLILRTQHIEILESRENLTNFEYFRPC